MRQGPDSQVGKHTRGARCKEVIRRSEHPTFLSPIFADDVLQAAVEQEIESPASRIANKIRGQTPIEGRAATLMLEDFTEDS